MARKPKQIDELEALPESDRLEGFAHPRDSSELIGHQKQVKEFLKAWSSGRMHHAWLLSGASGIGKATFAYQLARIVLSYNNLTDDKRPTEFPDEDSSVSRQLRALSHPGLLLIRRAWTQKDNKFYTVIRVEDVRRLRNFINMTTEEGQWRVVIVDRADEMNTNAANALLKTLEEPPQNCLFFLITEAVGRMPPTIRSRCRKLDFTPLEPNDLKKTVLNCYKDSGYEEPEHYKLKTLSEISNGSVRQSLELLGGKGLENYEKIISILKTLPKIDYGTVYELSEKLSTQAALPDFNMFNQLLSDILHRIIRVGAGSGDAPEQEIHIAMKIIKQDNLAQWAELWETIAKAKQEVLGLNLDRKSYIIEVFHKIQQIIQGK